MARWSLLGCFVLEVRGPVCPPARGHGVHLRVVSLGQRHVGHLRREGWGKGASSAAAVSRPRPRNLRLFVRGPTAVDSVCVCVYERAVGVILRLIEMMCFDMARLNTLILPYCCF